MPEVLTTAEANRRHGAERVRHRVRSGRWQRPVHGVVVTHNGPLSREEVRAVALAACPPGSALAGLTALEVDGFRGFEPSVPHVVLPSGARRPHHEVVPHWSTELGEADVHPARHPRRTRPGRSVVDAASWQDGARLARTVVVAAVQQGVTSPRQVLDALTRRGPCRHRALVVESVLDVTGGVQSLPERDFAAIWAATGLPHPQRQHRAQGPAGRYYLDVWCAAMGFGVEVHGLPHREVLQWDGDLVRANELVIGGRPLLTFSSYAVRHEPGAVADQLVRMARTRGWRGATDLSTFAGPWPQERRTIPRTRP